MRKSAASALVAITALALVLRLSPLARFVYFGSDVGEYFRISQGLVGTGHVSLAYAGWGVTYPYFPGMYFLVAGTTFGGLELSGSLGLVVPAIAALVPALVFLIAARVLREDTAALVAAAFVAVAMPLVFQTAHPIPATVGEVLAVAALVLFLRLPADPKAWALLVPTTVALVVTHHLAAYFLIVMLLIAVALRAIVRPAPVPGLRSQAAYVAFLAALALGFWLGYATTFRTNILADVDVQPWWLPLAALPALVLALAGIVVARRRIAWRYRPAYSTSRRVLTTYVAALVAILALVGAAVAVGIPGTTIRLSPAVLWYFLPLFGFIALAGSGRRHLDFAGRGLEVSGWFLAIVLSIGFGALAAPRVLIPYRHIEFALLALALPVGAGFARTVELGNLDRRRFAAFAFAGVLVAGSAVTAFPPTGVLVGFEEGARPAAVSSAYWVRGNVDGLLATDHRGSTLAFGVGGVDATWDAARLTLVAGSFADAEAEMRSVHAPSGDRRVDFVMIDGDLVQGVQFAPWEPARPLGDAARGKFADAPYVKVFDSGYAQVYWVDWGLVP